MFSSGSCINCGSRTHRRDKDLQEYMCNDKCKEEFEVDRAMGKFYFTFGIEQENAEKCQPIEALNMGDARGLMVQIYGRDWSFSYTESDFNNSKSLKNLELLPVLKVKYIDGVE